MGVGVERGGTFLTNSVIHLGLAPLNPAALGADGVHLFRCFFEDYFVLLCFGVDKIFKAAGFEWREPGCSMCLGMNPDQLKPGQRCASTSNRNFEGRQGYKGRTHLVSPQMAAAAAIAGHFVDIRDWR